MWQIYSNILTERGPGLHSLAKQLCVKELSQDKTKAKNTRLFFFITIVEIRPCVISSIALTCPNGKSPSML